ncbi:uncharacterized protein LOC112126136 isoform X2 [Cimex lectularius]|nr:uncharacterized protein LOC112126136 isoform X2 [Cimex lectularius]
MILASEEEKKAVRREIDRLVKRIKPKPVKKKVKKITEIDKMLHRSVTTGTNKYFSTGHGAKERLFLEEGSPYSQDYKGFTTKAEKKYMEPTENWRSRVGICERLRVESPTVDKGVTGVIPDFYEMTFSRPIRERFRKREYVQQVRSAMLTNLQTGMYLDIIKRIEMHDDIARSILQKAVDDSEEAVWSLRVFLSEQIKDIRSIEDELKIVVDLRTKKEAAIDLALRILGNTKVEMFETMEKINETIRCRDFLHSCSSEQWLYEYDIKKQNHFLKQMAQVEELMKVYANYMNHLGGKDPGLEEIMLNYIKIYEETGPKKIEFKTTNDLGYSLKKLEKDCKNALIHIKEIEEPVKKVRKYDKDVEKCYKGDIDYLKTEIKKTEEDLADLRANIDMKKSMMHDMTKKYKRNLISKEVLYERGLLKALYDEIVVDKKMNPTVLDMWEGLEESFMALKSKLAEIPAKEVKRRKRIIISRIKAGEFAAVKAQNRIRQVEQMVEGIKRAYEKPGQVQIGKALMPRSEPPPPPPRRPTPESPARTIEYAKELEKERRRYAPMAKGYPPVRKLRSLASSELSLVSEKGKQMYEVYDRESLVPKHKVHPLKDVYVFDSDDELDFKGRLAIEEPSGPTELKMLPPPKLTMPKYEPKVEEVKKTTEDEDSDFGMP